LRARAEGNLVARVACGIALLAAAACREEAVPAAPAPPMQAGNAELEHTLAPYAAAPQPDVNVLLITLDSVRSDYLSCYGHAPNRAASVPTSPHIDALAAEGVLLEDYYSNTSWTLPAHMAIMSGQPDLIHSVDDPLFALHDSRPTIAAVLQRAGYFTAGFFSAPFVHPRYGFARGFDRYTACYGPAAMAAHEALEERLRAIDEVVRQGRYQEADTMRAATRDLELRLDGLAHQDRSAALITDRAIAAIDEAVASGRRWFVFAHYFDPHYDYDPPDEYGKRFDPDWTGDLDGRRYFSNPRIGTRRDDPDLSQRVRVCTDRELDHIKALYEGEIAWTDAQVGRLLDHLRGKGLLDRTLVIVTADHGEEFFEHGGIGHRSSLFEEQVRVPLVMRLAGRLPAGKRVRGLASHVDLFATVLDALRLPPLALPWSRSVLPLVDGAESGAGRRVLGRLVQYHAFAPIGGPNIARNTIVEFLREGSIKVFRARRWLEPMPDCPPDRAEKVNAAAVTARVTDARLDWVDLAESPGEAADAFRNDFDDPRAAMPLRAFQDLYRRLLDDPRAVTLSLGELARIMGATATWERGVAARRAKYVLPPPGS
jgi:arylsulfatase